jgi:hypothetical protein
MDVIRWLLSVCILPCMQTFWNAYALCKLQEYLQYGGELDHMCFEMWGKASVWNLFTKHCSLRLTRILLILVLRPSSLSLFF